MDREMTITLNMAFYGKHSQMVEEARRLAQSLNTGGCDIYAVYLNNQEVLWEEELYKG